MSCICLKCKVMFATQSSKRTHNYRNECRPGRDYRAINTAKGFSAALQELNYSKKQSVPYQPMDRIPEVEVAPVSGDDYKLKKHYFANLMSDYISPAYLNAAGCLYDDERVYSLCEEYAENATFEDGDFIQDGPAHYDLRSAMMKGLAYTGNKWFIRSDEGLWGLLVLLIRPSVKKPSALQKTYDEAWGKMFMPIAWYKTYSAAARDTIPHNVEHIDKRWYAMSVAKGVETACSKYIGMKDDVFCKKRHVDLKIEPLEDRSARGLSIATGRLSRVEPYMVHGDTDGFRGAAAKMQKSGQNFLRSLQVAPDSDSSGGTDSDQDGYGPEMEAKMAVRGTEFMKTLLQGEVYSSDVQGRIISRCLVDPWWTGTEAGAKCEVGVQCSDDQSTTGGSSGGPSSASGSCV